MNGNLCRSLSCCNCSDCRSWNLRVRVNSLAEIIRVIHFSHSIKNHRVLVNFDLQIFNLSDQIVLCFLRISEQNVLNVAELSLDMIHSCSRNRDHNSSFDTLNFVISEIRIVHVFISILIFIVLNVFNRRVKFQCHIRSNCPPVCITFFLFCSFSVLSNRAYQQRKNHHTHRNCYKSLVPQQVLSLSLKIFTVKLFRMFE